MPRRPRLILASTAVHLIQRGHNRRACFRQTSDYYVYLMNLRDLARNFGCQIHAFCLMTNHVHLLLTPPDSDACSSLMKRLGQRYAQYFNREHSQSGTIWEGRFRSCIAESARYVLACYRYIELNPIRARMVATAREYDWSSHRANSGHMPDPSLDPHPEYLALGDNAEARHAAYRRLFDSHEEPYLQEIRRATNGGYPLASELVKSALNVARQRLEPGTPGPRASKAASDRNSGSDPELF